LEAIWRLPGDYSCSQLELTPKSIAPFVGLIVIVLNILTEKKFLKVFFQPVELNLKHHLLINCKK